ncbi:MAG TPA: hypothetical protein DIS99_02460 [Acinetobacter johnsonii]|nr:hypothetical protein [Acinetobacter johnsonii]
MAQESILRIIIDSRNAERNARALANELDSIEKKGDFASKSMDSMSVATRQLAGYMAGVVTVGAAIGKMDAYTGMQNRLKLVTQSQEQLNLAMSDTFNIAQKSYQSWDSVIQVYQRFSDNAKTLRIDMAKTAELTETVSKAVAISGASTQAAEAALTQFGQALASGVLRGEELNSILEQTPALAKAIAQGMGITVGELRSVAAEGKITGDVLVEALTKSKASVDELFSRTDVTIGQSLTLLNNEITKFVGEAGQASGAASVMADSIKLLGQNLSTIADAAVLGGIAYLTKAIITQTTSIYGYVTASAAQRAATITQQQASIAAATATLNEAKAHLANVQATNAETQSKYGATAAAVRYKVASDAVTQALLAQAAAQGAANGAATIGSRALALVGGPIGAITLGVTALAAGYMYMQSRTAEANAKLEEQAKVANKTKEELLALEGAQRKSAQVDLATAFAAQNKELNALNQQFNAAVISVQNYAVKNQVSYESLEKIREISSKVRQGLISQEEAIKQINNLYFVTPDQIKQIKNLNDEYEIQRGKTQNTADAQSVYGTKVTLAGNAASNAAGNVNSNSNALDDNANAARNAANAQSEYIKSLRQTVTQTQTVNNLIAKGMSPERAKALSEAYFKNNQKLSATDVKLVDANIAANKKLQASEDAITNSKKRSTSATKSKLSEDRKAADEAKRLTQEQFDLRESIYYKYADSAMKIEKDLQREIADIQKANFSSEQTSGYIQNAKNRAELEKSLYIEQLAQDLNEWQDTEEEKLTRKVKINELLIKLDMDMNDELKQQALDSLIDRSNRELAEIKLAQETRLFQMREALMSETAAMQERYRLEREQILLNSKLSQEQKQREIALSKALQEEENRKRLNNAVQQWGGIQAEMNGTGDQYRLEQERFSRYGASQDVFDAQMSQVDQAAQDPNANMQELAAQREAIWQEHHDRMTAIESDYQVASMQLQLSYGEQMASSMTTMMGAIFGEKSRAYAAAFAIEKGFAVAQAALALGQNIAEASKVGFPYNIPMIAGAMAQGAQIASIISSVAAPTTGYKTGGYTGNYGVNQEAGVVHGQEYVLNAEATKRVGVNTLNAINNGGTIQAEKQAQASAKAGGGQQSQGQQFTIINQIEQDDLVGNYMRGATGGQILLNQIKANPSEFKRALGV